VKQSSKQLADYEKTIMVAKVSEVTGAPSADAWSVVVGDPNFTLNTQTV